MPLTVLTDSEVRQLLLSLTQEDALELQENLAEALHSYSTGDTNSPCCSSFQPQRTVIKKNGITTLFMPASTGDLIGMKVVSLEQPDEPIPKPLSTSSSSAVSSVKSSMPDLSGLTLTPASTISVESNDGSSFQPPVSVASSHGTPPRGTVTLLDSTGHPVGIINAEELTAFRTALAATMLFKRRQNVHTITLFGAGKQAYWHIRLALLFRGDQIRHVNIINRSFEGAIKLMKSFQFGDDAKEEWRQDIKFSALSPEFGEYGRLLKEEVRKADVIFCCTPSIDPLFPAEFLTSREGQRKGRYISAIGSYAPHMCEIHPDILKAAVSLDHGHHHYKHADQGGVIVVDSLEACLKEAGEVIQAQLRPDHLVEIGELMMINRAATKELEGGGPGEQGLVDWLTKGNVIYKSVGMGLMDLVVGGDLIKLARDRNMGTTIPDF